MILEIQSIEFQIVYQFQEQGQDNKNKEASKLIAPKRHKNKEKTFSIKLRLELMQYLTKVSKIQLLIRLKER
jgi:hypothetical protein